MPNVAMLYHFAECHFAECHFAECHFAECHFAECHFADCHFDECHFDECHFAECHYDWHHDNDHHYAKRHYAECYYAECMRALEFIFVGGRRNGKLTECHGTSQVASIAKTWLFLGQGYKTDFAKKLQNKLERFCPVNI